MASEISSFPSMKDHCEKNNISELAGHRTNITNINTSVTNNGP